MGGPEKKGESDKEQKNKLFRHKNKASITRCLGWMNIWWQKFWLKRLFKSEMDVVGVAENIKWKA